MEEPGHPLINPVVVASGCAEHANIYAIYAVDSRQASTTVAGRGVVRVTRLRVTWGLEASGQASTNLALSGLKTGTCMCLIPCTDFGGVEPRPLWNRVTRLRSWYIRKCS